MPTEWGSPQIVAAIIAAAVSIFTNILLLPLKHVLERNMIGHKLRLEHSYEQKKRLRETIGRYHGLLLICAETINQRMLNLYRIQGNNWLSPSSYSALGYFFYSMVFRFVHFLYVLTKLEQEALYIDLRIGEKRDLEIIKFGKGIISTLTDLRLYDGLDYDKSGNRDHFYTDVIKSVSEKYDDAGVFIGWTKLKLAIENSPANYAEFLNFFLDLKRDEPRYRWDRLVVFHIFIAVLLNRIGYDIHRTTTQDLESIAAQIQHPEIAANMLILLPTLALDKRSNREIAKALKSAVVKRRD